MTSITVRRNGATRRRNLRELCQRGFEVLGDLRRQHLGGGERHSKVCPTNNRSAVAANFDGQIETILAPVQLPSDWLERVTASVMKHGDGSNPEALKKRLRRFARVYAYGDLGDDEYEAARAEIESELRQSSVALRPTHQEAASLFADMPQLWGAATIAEKHRMVRLLLERVYVDMDSRLITAIVPTTEFGLLLQHALEAAERSDVLLVPPEHVDVLDALHAYANGEQVRAWSSDYPSGDGHPFGQPSPAEQLEMVETGEN